jgi:MoxR-like ATPase
MDVRPPEAETVLRSDQLIALQQLVDEVFVHHAVRDYAVRLVMATRDPVQWGVPDLAPQIGLGASPRATLGLLAAGRALALLRGRRYLVPQDVFDVAPEVLRHRLMLTYDAIADRITVDDVLRQLLSVIHAPHVAPSQDEQQPIITPPPTRWQDTA